MYSKFLFTKPVTFKKGFYFLNFLTVLILFTALVLPQTVYGENLPANNNPAENNETNNTLIVALAENSSLDEFETKVEILNRDWQILNYTQQDLEERKRSRDKISFFSDQLTSNFTTFEIKQEKYKNLAVNKLSSLAGVRYVEPVFTYEPLSYTPSTPRFAIQWQLKDSANGNKSQSAWTRMGQILRNTTNCENIRNNDRSCGGDKNIKVAVIDSGLAKDALPGIRIDERNAARFYGKFHNRPCARPSLTTNSDWSIFMSQDGIYNTSPFSTGICGASGPATLTRNLESNQVPQGVVSEPDNHGHGTEVSAIIAMPDDSENIIGIAHNITILPISLQSDPNVGSRQMNTLEVTLAVDYAVSRGANVINLSIGGRNNSLLLSDAIDNAVRNGVVVVAASGNTGTNTRIYPAYLPNVISVGSANSNRNRFVMSTFNDRLDLVAPVNGISPLRNMKTITRNGNIRYSDGTSFTAPQVSATAALLLSIPTLTNRSPNHIRGLLTSSADDLGPRGRDDETGWGLLNVDRTLQLRFPDVPTSHPFDTYIHNLRNDGIISGFPDGTYRPSTNVDRGAMAKFIKNGFNISRNLGCGNFPDVNNSHTFHRYITTLKCANVITGFPDGTYRPSTNVDRGAMAKFIVNGANIDQNHSCPQFSDIADSHPFASYIRTLRCEGIIDGFPDGTYRPSINVDRGAMAKFIDNARR